MKKIKLLIILAYLPFSACTIASSKNRTPSNSSSNTWRTDTPPSIREISMAVEDNNVDEKLAGMKDWWLYGPGMGKTMINMGTTLIFPPYGLYLLTNAGLSFMGLPPIKPIEAIPEGPKEVIDEAFDDIISVPGRITALANDKQYITELK